MHSYNQWSKQGRLIYPGVFRDIRSRPGQRFPLYLLNDQLLSELPAQDNQIVKRKNPKSQAPNDTLVSPRTLIKDPGFFDTFRVIVFFGKIGNWNLFVICDLLIVILCFELCIDLTVYKSGRYGKNDIWSEGCQPWRDYSFSSHGHWGKENSVKKENNP